MKEDYTRVVKRATTGAVMDEHRPWGYFPIFLLVSISWDRVRPQKIDQEAMGTWLLESI